ncbi:tRNA (N6-isopentenyl adenosine(37)-C2)-methylthiotransferase MiaB [Buchnera aphidicola]|uniref:tRNA (N6-isopentenyl adenosine(37)-C2)-methylthiotransferase MiaB n=1 Tax=Buchnera aphidicola TaxID=9 RepID=UPI0030EB2831
MNNKKYIYIKTWGCQMNEYDSFIIKEIFNKKKYILTKNPKIANIIIVNTCSIREKAKEKLFHQLGRWKKLKIKNKKLIIAVGGCVASQERKKIFKRTHLVDIIFGTQTIHNLPKLIKKHKKKKKKIIQIKKPNLKKFKFFPKKPMYQSSSFVSIIEGCNKYCSFCIVPYSRNREISRNYKNILEEIYFLTKKGVKEITLLGQNVNSYKIIKKNHIICDFSELLFKISKIKKIKRIRFTTSHPAEFNKKMIKMYKKIPKLVNTIHLPVQSGSDKILKKMKRNYTIKEYEKIIKKLKSIRPNISITSDFIVGFPGETEKDFKKTIKLVKRINFDSSFSFIYSPRPKTHATKLKDNINLIEKKKRLYILQKILRKQTNRWSKKMIGSVQKVLVYAFNPKNNLKLLGKTENNRIVSFKGTRRMIGKLINVKINYAHMQSLKGFIEEKRIKNT